MSCEPSQGGDAGDGSWAEEVIRPCYDIMINITQPHCKNTLLLTKSFCVLNAEAYIVKVVATCQLIPDKQHTIYLSM